MSAVKYLIKYHRPCMLFPCACFQPVFFSGPLFEGSEPECVRGFPNSPVSFYRGTSNVALQWPRLDSSRRNHLKKGEKPHTKPSLYRAIHDFHRPINDGKAWRVSLIFSIRSELASKLLSRKENLSDFAPGVHAVFFLIESFIWQKNI